MLIIYSILKWINKITSKAIIVLNKEIELKKIYKKIKASKNQYQEIEGKKGYVIIIQYDTEGTDIVMEIKKILVTTDYNGSKENMIQTDNLQIPEQSGLVIKEIKFDQFFKKEDLYNIINEQVKYSNMQSVEKNQEQYDNNYYFNSRY